MPQITPAALSDARIIAAYAIFAASYLVFALGKFPGMKIDRPGAAIIGAVLMAAFRIVTPLQALRDIDFTTIVLLFSMMLIVGNLRLVGFFEWITGLVLRWVKPVHLLPTVIVTCGVLSAFFVNDIICLVMAPLVLAVTRRMNVRPLAYLLAVATASNIGSVATITGNPQNMLIGSYSGISYRFSPPNDYPLPRARARPAHRSPSREPVLPCWSRSSRPRGARSSVARNQPPAIPRLADAPPSGSCGLRSSHRRLAGR